jgi:hypothetical protein
MTTATAGVISNPSIQADAIRVCRLGNTGAPIMSSATGAYQNYAFTKVDAKNAMETANEFVQRSADGGIFIDYRDDDKIKWIELSLEIQYPDPCLMELLENGALLLGPTATPTPILGYEAPPLASNINSNPVSLEVWSKAPVGVVQTGTYQWYRWLFPFTRGWHRNDITYENNPETFTYEGWGFEQPNFGTGPFSDWTTTETSEGTALNSTRVWEWIASTALPTPLAPGYFATPA